MNQIKYTQSTLDTNIDFGNTNGFLTIPDTVFSTWQVIETQLSQVDPAKDPDIYQALDNRANTLFNSWLAFRRA